MAHRTSIWAVIVYSCLLNKDDVVSAVHKNSITLSSTYHIIDKKPLSVVDDRFLSYTLEPGQLTHVADCREMNDSSNLIRTLVPAYLRIAGPDSKKVLFQNQQPDEATNVTVGDVKNRKLDKILVTGPQWLNFIDFVKNATALQIIVSLNGNLERDHSDLDLTNALEFITFSNKNNMDLDWELGYEFQKMSDHDGRVLGRDVTKLRKVLDVFPRYRKSLILGPDVTSLETRADLAFVQTYLSEADDSLDAFTLHYDFSNLKEDDDVFEKLAPIFNRMDTFLWFKEGVLKTIAKGVVEKKSIWLSESENRGQYCTFAESLSFVQRLGAAAKLGVSVYLRKPHMVSLSVPTSEYWAAVLFKSLVGKTVLEAKHVDGNNTKVFAFGHCTRVLSNSDDSIINPNVAYKPGAITLYGVNTGSEWSRFFFKLNSRYEQVVHLYVLTEEGDSYTGKTLFNRQELRLSEDNELPIVFPRIREYTKYVVLPPKSIFFLVLPYANSRTCAMSPSNADESQDIAKKRDESVHGENETDLVGILEEDEPDDSAVYVSYSRKQAAQGSTSPSPSPKAEPAKNTKFITYSEDTWLSPLPNQLKEIFYRSPLSMKDDVPHSKKEKRLTKIENYRVITQALLGKRNISQLVLQEPLSRFSRSMDTYADDTETEGEQERDDEVHETVAVDEHTFDVDHADTETEDTNDEQRESDVTDALVRYRVRRDANPDNSSLGTSTLPPASSDEETLFDFERAARLFDSEDSDENVRFSREISADISATANEHLPSTRSPRIAAPLPRKIRKSKFSDEIVLSRSAPPKTPAPSVTSNSSPSSDANPTTPSVSVPVTEESSTSTPPPASDLKSEAASRSDILASETFEHVSEVTTTMLATKMTPIVDVASGARSMIEPSNEEWKTVEYRVEEDVNVQKPGVEAPHQKPKKKMPIVNPIKRKPGYMSTPPTTTTTMSKPNRRSRITKPMIPSSTTPSTPVTSSSKRIRATKSTILPSSTTPVAATTKRSRIAKRTSTPASYVTRKKAVKPNYDHGMRSADDALPKLVEATHAKLKKIVDANHARIQMLKDERMQQKLLHSDLQPTRRKREIAQNMRNVGTPFSSYAHLNQLQSGGEGCQQTSHGRANDAFDKAKDVCKDLSTHAKDLYSDASENVRDKLHSLTNWIREKYDEINKELVSTRSKHDLIGVRKQIRDYSTKIQKELANMRERLRSHPKTISHRKSGQKQAQAEPVRVNVLEMSSTPLSMQHQHHHYETDVVMGKNAEAYEDRELATSMPIQGAGLNDDGNGTNDPFLNSRPIRSIESNEISSENDLYSAKLADNENQNKSNSLDYFEANMVDTKLRKAISHFYKMKKTTTVAYNSYDEATNKVDHQHSRGDDASKLFSEVPSEENIGVDDDICDRNANVVAYIWCKCKNFLIVVISLLNNNRSN